MSAQPVDECDPYDPVTILTALPESERAVFLRQYRTAVGAARDPAGYRHQQQVLQGWSLVAIVTGHPGHEQDLEEARRGTAVPVEQAIPDWTERTAAIRASRKGARYSIGDGQ